MTEEDSKVMNLLHNKEKMTDQERKEEAERVERFNNSPQMQIIQADLDREMEERQQEQKEADDKWATRTAKAVKEIFATSDPDEVITTTFTDEELQKYVRDRIEEELRNITPKQLFNLAIVTLGGDNCLVLEFTKMSKANNYEVLEIPKGNKYFSTLYRPAKSTSEFVMLRLPPKQN